jgi:CBS domain-containing protein
MGLLTFCDPDPPTVSLEATVEQAIGVMIEQRVGAVVVVDTAGVVAGIFTERDVLTKLALTGNHPKNILIRALMTTPVEMATEETGEAEALAVMVERHYRHLPIVDAEGKLLGLLSLRNLLQARIDDLLGELDTIKSR